MTPAPPLLHVQQVTKQFGGLTAVADFNLTLQPGELVGLIGPNGAGKTTAFNLITGVYPPTEGHITLTGKPTRGLTPDRIAALGISRTFQNIRLFDSMTVLENVKTAYTLNARYGFLDAIFKTRRYRDEEALLHDRSLDLLRLFHLEDDAHVRADTLAYGEQRRLEIARALATSPRLLLLDEPAAGMNAQETEDLMAMIRDIKSRFDLTILLIEHDMRFVMQLCERIVVLEYGRIIAEGTPRAIRDDPRVIAAYLGDSAEDVDLTTAQPQDAPHAPG